MPRRPAVYAAICCVFFFIASLLSSAGLNWNHLPKSGEAITADELTYIASGYYYAHTGRYFFNSEHPPLVKDIAALPSLFVHPIFPIISKNTTSTTAFTSSTPPVFSYQLETKNSQWQWGTLFLFNSQNNPDVLIFLSRLCILIVNTLLLGLIFFSLTRLIPPRAALVGLFLLTFSPLSLGFGPLVILDFTSTLLILLSSIWFALFVKQYKQTEHFLVPLIISGVFTALACLAKNSALILVPVLGLGGFISVYVHNRSYKRLVAYCGIYALLLVAIGGIVVMWYMPHTTHMNAAEIDVQIEPLIKNRDRLLQSTVHGLRSLGAIGRGATEYMASLLQTDNRLRSATQRTYFLETMYDSSGTPWYYYPILLITKLPLGLWVMLLSVIAATLHTLCKRRSAHQPCTYDELNILGSLFIIIYSTAAFHARLQLGLRYLLPVIGIACLLIGRAVDASWSQTYGNLKLRSVFMLSFCLVAFSSLISYPYYLSYYNIVGGGTKHGYTIAVDSNYDWGGQDLKRLGVWIESHHIPLIYADIFATAPAYYIGSVYRSYSVEFDPLPPSGTYVVISAYQYAHYSIEPKTREIIQKYFPFSGIKERVGTTMFIFQLP